MGFGRSCSWLGSISSRVRSVFFFFFFIVPKSAASRARDNVVLEINSCAGPPPRTRTTAWGGNTKNVILIASPLAPAALQRYLPPRIPFFFPQHISSAYIIVRVITERKTVQIATSLLVRVRVPTLLKIISLFNKKLRRIIIVFRAYRVMCVSCVCVPMRICVCVCVIHADVFDFEQYL